MIKTIKILVVTVVMMLTMVGGASAYEQHLNGDPNYDLLYGKQGVATYLDRSSCVKRVDNSEVKVWAQNHVVVDTTNGNIINTSTIHYAVDITTSPYTYYTSKIGTSGTWNPFDMNDRSDATAAIRNGFWKGFQATFGYSFS